MPVLLSEELGVALCAGCTCAASHGLSLSIGSGYGIDCVTSVGPEGNAFVIADMDHSSLA